MHEKQKGFGLAAILVTFILVAFVVIEGWYVWTSYNKPHATNSSNQAPNATAFKIPPLGVEFTLKEGATPLYFIQNLSWNNANYELIRFSTQQLVDKGAMSGTAACEFSTIDTSGHALLSVAVYNSQADLLRAVDNPNITPATLVPANGYFAIGGKIFAVPQGVDQGSGDCIADGHFENDQRVTLRESLMTLRAIP